MTRRELVVVVPLWLYVLDGPALERYGVDRTLAVVLGAMTAASLAFTAAGLRERSRSSGAVADAVA